MTNMHVWKITFDVNVDGQCQLLNTTDGLLLLQLGRNPEISGKDRIRGPL